MATYLAKLYITYKNGILDPQGSAVEKAIHNLGFQGVEGVRVGKYITMRVSANSSEEAKEKVEEMVRRFLVNPVTETYTYDVEEVKG